VSNALRKQLSFDVNLQQAFKSPDGKMHVVGVASDDLEDRTGDRMSSVAIGKMVHQAKTGKLPLLDNHKSTFGFGKTFDASARKITKKGKTHTQLVIDFELDDRYPQAQDLYDEVSSGKAEKQLSIGGFLPLDNPKAIAFETVGKRVVRRIDDILLEHVATTRPGMAAVPRTKFVGAIIKDIFGDDSDLPDAWHHEVGEQIERQVDAGASEGVANTPNGPVDFQVMQKQDDGNQRTIVVILDSSKITGQNATKEVTKEDEPKVELEPEVAKETTETEELVSTHEEKSMADAKQTPDAKPESGENNAAIRGLSVLTTIGKAFDASQKIEKEAAAAADASTEPKIEKEVEIVVQAEITELAKSYAALEGLELNEKSSVEVRRIVAGMAKLLDMEVGSERAATDSVFSLKSAEEFTTLVTKSVDEALAKAVAAKTEDKSAADVIEIFEKSFEGLTTELAKGLIGMGEGFKALLHKSVEETATAIAKLEKTNDERLEKLEKAAGVRQSMPTQAPEVATGTTPAATAVPQVPGSPVQKSVRAPDAANPFRGTFDRARKSYMASHR